MQKHTEHNKDERTQFFRKIYLSLYWKDCVWEVSWKLNKDCNILTPQLFWLSQPFFAVLLGCLTGGLGAQPLLGHGSHSSIFSPTDLNFLSPRLYNNLTLTDFLRASQFALNSTLRQSRLSPWYLRPDAPVMYTGVFFLLTAWPGRRSICNILFIKKNYPFSLMSWKGQNGCERKRERASKRLMTVIIDTALETHNQNLTSLFLWQVVLSWRVPGLLSGYLLTVPHIFLLTVNFLSL